MAVAVLCIGLLAGMVAFWTRGRGPDAGEEWLESDREGKP
jgi:hypothetical protein